MLKQRGFTLVELMAVAAIIAIAIALVVVITVGVGASTKDSGVPQYIECDNEVVFVKEQARGRIEWDFGSYYIREGWNTVKGTYHPPPRVSCKIVDGTPNEVKPAM